MGSGPNQDDVADAEIVETADLTPEQATELLAQVQTLTGQLYATADKIDKLLVQLHDRKGWKALGCSSWTAFVEEKLPFGERRARQRLAHGRIVLELESTGTNVPVPSEGHTRGHANVEDFRQHQERRRQEREAQGAAPVQTPLQTVPDTFPEPGRQAQEPGPSAADSEPFGTAPEPATPRRQERVSVGTATEVIPRPKPAPKPSKVDIRRVEDMMPALTQVQDLADRIGDFPALPSLERRKHWLREMSNTRQALKALEDKIKATMQSPGDDV